MVKFYQKRGILIYVFLVTIFYFIGSQVSITANESSIFGDIYAEPLKPSPLSNVSFIVGVDKNITAEDVRLIVDECRGDMCFVRGFNVSMNYSYSCCWDFYETQIKLFHKDATKIKYYVGILYNGTWYKSDTNYANLSSPSNNNPVINPDNKSISGLDFVLFLFSAIIILIVFQYFIKKKK